MAAGTASISGPAGELAPDDQNHLLRTSSVIRSIDYAPKRIAYTKFDDTSTELFKLGASKPASVTGGKMNWGLATAAG